MKVFSTSGFETMLLDSSRLVRTCEGSVYDMSKAGADAVSILTM